MALFGFNKQKVLANAEKYVQQGKLQNAIAEYEKILKNDAKDLTVTNTVGDLYSRIGESDRATDCFKTVGDAYASQGFTVKAIAMYKKISKLKPSLENLLKLAELYTQQGLFNDARSQYLQVAEEFLKAGELENAVRIFQKILEMDPENSSMRVRLAEVYIRLGKKNEAWQIFTAAAESMRAKGALNEAEEILQRMLKLDPGNTYARQMQGRNLIESGDASAAVACLQKISDIDSHPESLRDLLKAYLQTGQLSDAGAIASKLLTVHNDLTAISTFADALMQAGQHENALQVYDQHAERLLAENSDKVLEHLHSIIGHVRENPDSLQKLLDLFNKAGENTHISEVTELLAHACVQSGDLTRARDLYQKLSQIEPQNSLHLQNYQQVVSQLSGASGTKLITPEEAVVLLDDLETTAPSIHQHYSDEVALAIRSALTDAELFISYNMPAKALGPLVAALPMAPNDLRINQRLAALHTRSGRFVEGAVCCRTLQSLYSGAACPDEATRYGELADRYEERASGPLRVASGEDAPIYLDAPPAQAEASAGRVPEFSIDEAPVASTATHPPVASASAAAWPAAEPEEAILEPAADNEFAVVDESSAVPGAPATAEIDLSSEWDDAITVEGDAPAAEPPPVAASASHAVDNSDEVIEEIRFYTAHGMPEQAMAALAKLQTVTRDHGKIAAIRAEVEEAVIEAAEREAAAGAVEPAPDDVTIEELTVDDIPSAESPIEQAPAAIKQHVAVKPKPVVEPPAGAEPPVEPAAESVEPAAKRGVLKEFVSALESSLGDNFLPSTVSQSAPPLAPPPPPVAPKVAPPAQTRPAAAAQSSASVMGKFVSDVEASVGEDFLEASPVVEKGPPVPVAKAKPTPPPAPVPAPKPTAATPKATPPLAASAAASSVSTTHVAPQAQPSAPVAWPTPGGEAPKPQPPKPAASAPAAKASSPFGEDAGVDLTEMFGELKHDLEADVAAADEDPETHYNLGIAFREMGLLDEAIGELQKACQSFDRGHHFPQVMQAYTWLAQCFLDKGVPEAAVRWYAKALNVPGIDGETRVALSYELASAYETAGDRASALQHFMDVYGSNIDYRDVAERIKALKT